MMCNRPDPYRGNAKADSPKKERIMRKQDPRAMSLPLPRGNDVFDWLCGLAPKLYSRPLDDAVQSGKEEMLMLVINDAAGG